MGVEIAQRQGSSRDSARPFHCKKGSKIVLIKYIQQPLHRVPSFHALRKTQNVHVFSSESILKIINAISMMISLQAHYFEITLDGAPLILYIAHLALQSRRALLHFLHIMLHDSNIIL